MRATDGRITGSRQGVDQPRRPPRSASVRPGALAQRFIHEGRRREADPVVGVPAAALTAAELRSVDRALQRTFTWRDNGFCLARAELGAQLVQEAFQRRHPDREGELAATVAVAFGPFDPEVPAWGYHAATVVRHRSGPEPLVIDHLLFDQPVRLSTWARKLGRQPWEVSVQSPYDKREWDSEWRGGREITRVRPTDGQGWDDADVREWAAQLTPPPRGAAVARPGGRNP